MYPKAKIIRTVHNSSEKWFESFKNTIEPVGFDIFYFISVYSIRNLRLQCILAGKLFKKSITEYGEIEPRLYDLYDAQRI
ncbi:unnamed protein product [Rotaria sp. Silwood2]|nr:unnamed protein product [Rotaria sp. Silwood2]CAF3125667.1 unnamed protein product [Rotaria sp. Silwood2]CAF3223215.1 unnamed protein product [Rotaria sp. Silwood2]CAF3979005.1 unnamed protein product [Rotaria sp. Silwood2]CAF4160393.1 unnamed protein product [Rotaria sp. Silwood2]